MTAVEFIEDYLKFKGIIIEKENYPQVIIGVINDAKEMEKQQIIDAMYICQKTDFYVKYYDAEQYYKETFNKQ
jgi:uncharacterized protein YciU (UPF0263 family)